MPHCDSASVVPPTEMLALPGNGQFDERTSLPEMIVDWALQVSKTGRSRLVCAQRNELLFPGALLLKQLAVQGDCGLESRRRNVVDGRGIGAGRGQDGSPAARRLEAAYPGLQHASLVGAGCH